jgi:hypothetical protein
MKRVLSLVPLLVLPPLLVAGYFICIEGVRPWSRPEISPTDDNLQAARTALRRANRFLDRARQARPGSSAELLTQAVVQYRVCLAYEPAAPAAGRLFEDARQNLEVSRLLLEQRAHPTPARPVGAVFAGTTVSALSPSQPETVSAQPTPVVPPVTKTAPPPQARPAPALPPTPKAEPARVATTSPAVPPEKPAKQPEPSKRVPIKTTTFGPDGIEYETIRPGAP